MLLKMLRKKKKEILSIVYSYNYTDENIQHLINYAKEHGGIDYAYRKIEEFKEQAEKIIETIPDSDVREALEATVDYIIKSILIKEQLP